jgi:DNA topoisomerase-1
MARSTDPVPLRRARPVTTPSPEGDRRAPGSASGSGLVAPFDLTAALVHSCDADPGIVRRGTRRFRYETVDGRRVTDPDVLARIAALAIPPAWTDVWICADACGHLQATGRDAKGRKQSRYHPAFRAEREQTKFEQLIVFGHALTALRTRVAADLQERRPTERRQTALVVHLLDRTGIRIGNEAYARSNGSYGLSTLRTRQARVHGADITFRFVGKSGRQHTVTVEDRRLAKLVAQCQDLPGQRLFTYLDDDGQVRTVDSTLVNGYLREVTREDVTAKTFRTWIATSSVSSMLATHAVLDGGPPTKKVFLEAIDHAAGILGNTRSVCRSSYVHPVVEQTWFDGTIADHWRAGPRRPTAGLTTAERRTLHLLETAGAPAAVASTAA